MNLGGSSIAGQRPHNEDAFLVKDVSEYKRQLGGIVGFLLVCDGGAGSRAGDVAAGQAVDAAESYVDDLIGMAEGDNLDIDVELALTEILTEAHQAVMAAAHQSGAQGMGATAVAAFVSRSKAWVGRVGDGRAYLLRRGQAIQQTEDCAHVDCALGLPGFEIETYEIELQRVDALMLCTDGVYQGLSEEAMAGLAASSATAQRAATRLNREAEGAGSDDNCTSALYANDWNGFRRATPHARGRSSRGGSGAQSRKMLLYGAIAAVVLVLLVIGACAVWPSGDEEEPVSDQPETTASVEATDTATAGAEETATADADAGQPGEAVDPPQMVTVKEDVPGNVWLRAEPALSSATLYEVREGSLLQVTRKATDTEADTTMLGVYLPKPEDITDETAEAGETDQTIFWVWEGAVRETGG